jgi:hypothetical protein
MLGPFHDRTAATYKLMSLADDCARQRFGGLGFVAYLESATAAVIENEFEFCNERGNKRFESKDSVGGYRQIIELAPFSVDEIRPLLLNVGRLCSEAPRISNAFAGGGVDAVVEAYLSSLFPPYGYPGPHIVGFVEDLWRRASAA